MARFRDISFGDGPDLTNRLLELVLSGEKRATCCAESQGLLSAQVGKLMVVLDGQGVPKAVLKTIELTKRRFDEVDEAFAMTRVKVIALCNTGAKHICDTSRGWEDTLRI
jgi:uncharacterized protein YhfF